jgi:hypothetical protein
MKPLSSRYWRPSGALIMLVESGRAPRPGSRGDLDYSAGIRGLTRWAHYLRRVTS